MSNRAKIINIYLLQIIKIGIFIIIFLPFLVNHNFLFPFVFPRTIAFRLIIEICLALYLFLIFLNRNFRPQWSVMLVLITGFIGLMIITSFFGVDWHHSLWSSTERSEGIISWLHFLAFFVILVNILKTKEDWLQLFKLIVVAGWLQTIYAFGQFFKSSYTILGTGQRISGTLGNPAFLATYLIFIIFIAAYLLTQKNSKKIKITCAALMILDLFLLWQTQIRGAILSLFLGGLFFIGLKFWRSKKLHLKILLAIILLAVPILAAALVINKGAAWVQSSNTLNRIATISPADITAQNRLIVWGAGGQGFLERPWRGWGWENFNVPFNKYFNPAITRDIGSRPWYDRAHNTVVEIAVATGIFGLLTYLTLIGWAAGLVWRGQKTNQFSFSAGLILTTLLLVYFLQNLFVFDTLISYLMFFLILAFIQSRQSFSVKKYAAPTPPAKAKTIFISTLLIVVIIIPLAYFLNLRPALANYYIIRAVTINKDSPAKMLESFKKSFSYSPANEGELRFILVQHARDQINLKGINQETIPLIQFAAEETKKSIQVNPSYIQNYLLLAELYLASSQLNPQHIQSAQDITLKALAIAPRRYQVYIMLGRLKMAQKQFAEGVDYFKQAIELNDRFAEAHWNLAIAYILSWQPELAQQSLDQAIANRLDIYDQKYINLLLLAYKDSKNLEATIDFLENLVQRFPDNQYYQSSLISLQEIKKQMAEGDQ